MRCLNCNSELKCTGGDSLEDFGCTNYDHCPERLECRYWINVKVRDNYWFSPEYAIPFKINNQWYAATGPFYDRYDPDYAITRFQKLSLEQRYKYNFTRTINLGYGEIDYGSIDESYPVSVQQDIYDIPYMALPVNEDFNYQLDVLINKLGRYLDI
jgi:hypothetical protein